MATTKATPQNFGAKLSATSQQAATAQQAASGSLPGMPKTDDSPPGMPQSGGSVLGGTAVGARAAAGAGVADPAEIRRRRLGKALMGDNFFILWPWF